MHNRRFVAAVLAGALLLAGCTSQVAGTPEDQQHAQSTAGAAGDADEPTADVPDAEVDVPTQTDIPLTDPWTPIYCTTDNEYFVEKCFQQDGDKLLDAFTDGWPEMRWKCAKEGEMIDADDKVSEDRRCHASVRYTDLKFRAAFDVGYDRFPETDKVHEIRMVAGARAFADEGERVSKNDLRLVARALSRDVFRAMLPDDRALRKQIDKAADKILRQCAKSDSLTFEATADLPIGYRLSCQGSMPISIPETTVTSYTMPMTLTPIDEQP